MTLIEVMNSNEEIVKDINTIFDNDLAGPLSDWLIELEKRLVQANEVLDEYDETVRNSREMLSLLTKLP